jgi:hypothetical protein
MPDDDQPTCGKWMPRKQTRCARLPKRWHARDSELPPVGPPVSSHPRQGALAQGNTALGYIEM